MSLKNISGLKREDFQAEVQGKQTDLFILRNNKGCEVAITNYGGALVAIMVPDRDGKAKSFKDMTTFRRSSVVRSHSSVL